jgi:DNA-binding transcriptional LysR family regulator
MEMREIRSLVVLAECGTIQETAARCHLSAPAVHKHLKTIQDEFGVRIYAKRNGRLELTDAGRLLLPFAREIVEQSESAAAAMHEWRDGRRGLVRVGAGPSFCSYPLPLLIKRYRSEFPSVEIFVETNTGDNLLRRLREGHLDLIFDLASSSTSELDIQPLAQWEASAGFVANRSEFPNPCPLSELKTAPFILYEQDTQIARLVDSHFNRLGFHPRVVMRCDSAETIKAVVRAGLGVSVLLLWNINSEPPDSPLTVLRTGGPRLTSSMVLLRMKSRYIPFAVEQFINLAKQMSWKNLRKCSRDEIEPSPSFK